MARQPETWPLRQRPQPQRTREKQLLALDRRRLSAKGTRPTCRRHGCSPRAGHIGKPDLVLTMPKPFTVPAEGVIEYQYFEVDPGFTEDRWVQAAEIRPGNRAVVHHCNVFLQPPGAEGPAEQGALGSYALAAMAAGTPPLVLPEGMAKRVPPGWKLVFVMHYSAIGSEQTDQTSIALKFADPKTVARRWPPS